MNNVNAAAVVVHDVGNADIAVIKIMCIHELLPVFVRDIVHYVVIVIEIISCRSRAAVVCRIVNEENRIAVAVRLIAPTAFVDTCDFYLIVIIQFLPAAVFCFREERTIVHFHDFFVFARPVNYIRRQQQ